ncbi:hypothetical protein [Nocardia sp. NPDC050717]|uniref:hypothetical protein n=1 Tax=Nocardia sp. NPDC050717 TaxID=3157221 RepID=UPI0033F25A98
MTSGEFDQPNHAQLIESFGADVTTSTDEATEVRIPLDNGESVVLQYNPLYRDARIRWIRDGACIFDISRESVQAIVADERGFISIHTGGHGLVGELTLGLYPVRIVDSLLIDRQN